MISRGPYHILLSLRSGILSHDKHLNATLCCTDSDSLAVSSVQCPLGSSSPRDICFSVFVSLLCRVYRQIQQGTCCQTAGEDWSLLHTSAPQDTGAQTASHASCPPHTRDLLGTVRCPLGCSSAVNHTRDLSGTADNLRYRAFLPRCPMYPTHTYGMSLNLQVSDTCQLGKWMVRRCHIRGTRNQRDKHDN